MEDVGLILVGAFGGAVATGAATVLVNWRARQNARRVAARLILGDLYVLEAMTELVAEWERWPDRLDLDASLDTWREARGAFAGDVKAWEWALVDGVFSNLHRISLMVEHGRRVSAQAVDVLQAFGESIPAAREVVLERASSEKERAQLVEQLLARKAPVAEDSRLSS